MLNLRKYIKYPIVLISAVVIVLSMVLLSVLIPRELISQHLETSYQNFIQEGKYPTYYGGEIIFLDNFTDSVALDIIANQDTENQFYSAIANLRDIDSDPFQAFRNGIDGVGTKEPDSNHWLGMLLPLKVLLVFFEYREIRYFMRVVAIMLMAALLISTAKKMDCRLSLAMFLGMMLMGYFNNVSSLAFAFDLLITLCAALMAVKYHDTTLSDSDKRSLFFFVLGIFEASWAFVCAQVCSLSMVAVILAYSDQKRGIENPKVYCSSLAGVLFWGAGYGSMLFAKQVIAKAVIGYQVGITKLRHWSEASFVKRVSRICVPFTNLLYRPLVVVLIIVAIVILILVISKKLSITKDKFINDLCLLGITAYIPSIWFMILVNGVFHGFYVYNLVPFFCVLIWVGIKHIKIGEVKDR